jgi:hypothetical protein
LAEEIRRKNGRSQKLKNGKHFWHQKQIDEFHPKLFLLQRIHEIAFSDPG